VSISTVQHEESRSGTLYRMPCSGRRVPNPVRPEVTVLVVLALLLAACGRQTVDIGPVAVSADGRTLTFGTGTCAQNEEATVVETPTTVTIRATAEREPLWGGSPGCDASASVTLNAPLGTRQVIDAATGETVRAESTETP
jgi:hypothetical protein